MGLDGLQAETLIDLDSFLDITKIWGFQKVGPIAGMSTLDSLIRTRTYRQRKAPNPLKPNPLLVGQKGDGIWGVGRNKTELMLRSPIR